jgi:hypothetical protein
MVRLVKLKMVEIAFVQARPRGTRIVLVLRRLREIGRAILIARTDFQEKNGVAEGINQSNRI